MADQQIWTKEETDQVIALLAKGLGPTAISKELGRTKDSVRHRMRFIKAKSIPVPVAPQEIKKEAKRQEPKPLRKKEQTGYVTYPPLEWCGECHAPVSNWVDHGNRMGCKRPL